MHTYAETTETTTKIVKKLVAMTCDLCGRSVSREDWHTKGYQTLDTVVQLEDGDSYPEGGDVTITGFDICPECFRTKLMPFLVGLGAKPTVTRRRW